MITSLLVKIELDEAKRLRVKNRELAVEVKRLTEDLIAYKELDRELEEKAGCDITAMPDMILSLRAELTALKNQKPVIPEGYALVPIKPTDKMIDAAYACDARELANTYRELYKYMLAAAQKGGV